MNAILGRGLVACLVLSSLFLPRLGSAQSESASDVEAQPRGTPTVDVDAREPGSAGESHDERSSEERRDEADAFPVAEALAEPDAVERLDAWLAHQRDEMRFARRVVGPLSLAAGVLMLAPGVYGLADGVWDEQPNLGWLAFAVAGLGFAQGAVWLAIQSDPEERYARWRAARARGMTVSELARFEGELRGTPSLARMERALIRWSGLGFVFGGGLYAAILAVDDPPLRHRVLGFATSALYGAVGVALLIYASLPELGETSWRRYEAGERPDAAPPVTTRLVPAGGCDREGCFAALSLRGTYMGR